MNISRLSKEEVFSLTREDIGKRFLNKDEIIHILESADALWLRNNNNRLSAHAVLKSGFHSDGFINCRKLFERNNLSEILAHQLLMKIAKNLYGNLCFESLALALKDDVNRIIGPVTGGAALAGKMAEILKIETGYVDSKTLEIGFRLVPGEKILVVEDVMTTGNTVLKTIEVFTEKIASDKICNIFLMPIIGLIANRKKYINNNGQGVVFLGFRHLIYLVDFKINNWEPDTCPLCMDGSAALRPKDNWERLLN